ncbi:MAG TPA: DUF302 domain-containing protein [Gammaproteobacteria bacterium]|nr:DUF302 domain-containing protein [Gammaproteobacteria bacterium]
MRIFLALIALAALLGSTAQASEGMITLKSAYSVKQTTDRLDSLLRSKGMTVMKRIDHAAGAASVGKQMRPTELLIFGNPKIGTPLMQCNPNVAIDLPQKALIWEDDSGQVWLAYNDPNYLALRHDLRGCEEVLAKVSAALGNFATAATMAE